MVTLHKQIISQSQNVNKSNQISSPEVNLRVILVFRRSGLFQQNPILSIYHNVVSSQHLLCACMCVCKCVHSRQTCHWPASTTDVCRVQKVSPLIHSTADIKRSIGERAERSSEEGGSIYTAMCVCVCD